MDNRNTCGQCEFFEEPRCYANPPVILEFKNKYAVPKTIVGGFPTKGRFARRGL